ncbi:hypothetical protein LFT44_04730 [Arthrobacter sp. FW306-05-C]|uniref:hypothetical protein n=1 Tax=Arthrobacter sp. FW306-05-C TaxID=2879620 RepID=UPI001F36E0E7|nr:hypothetical protein [Arthrobacter sp. FW306-05-C]UKA67726.1 hypothetical protein LFT44_04730 [Arthrobacter sp. FW306-05-C]
MIELTVELAQKLDRAAQILGGLSRVASRDCTWIRSSSDLHAEILRLQSDLREAAAKVTGSSDVSLHLSQARAVGTELGTLFQPEGTQDPATGPFSDQ